MGRIGNIKDRKAKQDSKRAKIYTKLARLITVAAKEGGIDPEYNANLKNAIDKAKSQNMPNDNIDRAIKKASNDSESNKFEKITYEGYGPNGVAVIVEALTDNRNRTAGDVRHAFDKNGGNLGTTGCVAFMFDLKGQIILEKKAAIDEDTLMIQALDAGAEDFISGEDAYEIITAPDDFTQVKDTLLEEGYEFINADIVNIPQTEAILQGEEIKKMSRLIDMLEDNDDIQAVHHNWVE
ncbi:YebC/PmpR family DNA-binding transcriptional regulator [Serpentinicella sp. ANB-PHB4]|uniref:YebC/PmpR family DNA-binding transcriptional regulator n=1 Tax=Serpentinicella sp. ANB-PHB4 TaxID=3074076 RepID=UPI0028610BBD|nr:YebC/PmpR family DNA-binding transcriptional regulator [Serpentinicella sp. ANB-PHB4]MDR5657868.1 YebC/PmpR family DNA-binding transcriptional regulator [Serpentinicella sp. ANB-PHB4]